LSFLNILSKKNKIGNIKFMKMRAVGPELIHADGRTDSTKLTVAFHNFANASENSQSASKRAPVLFTVLKTHSNTFSFSASYV
jgi:hypothetical protein